METLRGALLTDEEISKGKESWKEMDDITDEKLWSLQDLVELREKNEQEEEDEEDGDEDDAVEGEEDDGEKEIECCCTLVLGHYCR